MTDGAEFESSGRKCGIKAFVYFRATQRYAVLNNTPETRVDASAFGIADDNSVGVALRNCSSPSKQTSIYRVTAVSKKPHWSRPCTCGGYRPVGNSSDGIGLNSRKLGGAVLTFPGGAPHVTPLRVHIGSPREAQMLDVDMPSGFVGFQHNPATGNDVPTVWLNGRPYRLPVADAKHRPQWPYAMDERHTPHGLRVDVVGVFYDRLGVLYWIGKRKAHGFAFSEKRHFIKNPNTGGRCLSCIGQAYGLSTDGSMIFGDCCGDSTESLIVYFTASHRQLYHGGGCGQEGDGSGDSHGDILVSGGNHELCLAQPRH